jgi:hypothetical protein
VDARLRGHDGLFGLPWPRFPKVFWFFFSKKNRLPLLSGLGLTVHLYPITPRVTALRV